MKKSNRLQRAFCASFTQNSFLRKAILLPIVIAFYSIQTSSAQASFHHYQNLVMEGGGVRGFAYVGAFEMLDILGLLQPVQRVGGSSVGAIQAMLLATGYNVEEMKEVAAHIPLKTFNDGFALGGFHRLTTKLGFYKGKAVTAWIDALLEKKTGDVNITFRQFHNQKEEKQFKDLYVVATDLTYQCLRIFSYETYPDMKIKDAVRISMSVPLYFEPVYMDDNGHLVDRKFSGHRHLMSDGGLLCNYPIQMFDDETYGHQTWAGKVKENTETLGLILEKPEQIAYSKSNTGNYPLPIGSVRNYIGAMYHTLVDKPNPELTDSNLLRRTIMISNLNVSGRVRKLSPQIINAFVESGRQGVKDFFKL